MAGIDGIYVGYFSGMEGNGLGLFHLLDGCITGADAFGVTFDGTYQRDDKGGYAGRVKVVAPPNGILVQGVSTGPTGVTYETDVELPEKFEAADFLKLTTPFGPVNVRLQLVRKL